jgi:hypothetical protein
MLPAFLVASMVPSLKELDVSEKGSAAYAFAAKQSPALPAMTATIFLFFRFDPMMCLLGRNG